MAISIPTAPERAWLAGIYEGEGNVFRPKGRNWVRVTISMTDRDTVQRFHDLTAHLRKTEAKRWYERDAVTPYGKKARRRFETRLYGREEVQQFIIYVWNWLGERRRGQFREALRRLPSRRPYPFGYYVRQYGKRLKDMSPEEKRAYYRDRTREWRLARAEGG